MINLLCVEQVLWLLRTLSKHKAHTCNHTCLLPISRVCLDLTNNLDSRRSDMMTSK